MTTAETILVVDDHECLCELIEVILGRAGYRVLTATNGTDALRLARNISEIDLLLTDIEMPGMNGDELARRFATLHPAAAVTFISSSARPLGLQPPCEFVSKPFTVAILRDAVRRALRTRTALEDGSRAA